MRIKTITVLFLFVVGLVTINAAIFAQETQIEKNYGVSFWCKELTAMSKNMELGNGASSLTWNAKVKIRNINGTLPPSSGNWTISNTTIVEGSILIINGSIVVESSGSLVLRNTSIYMNLTEQEQYWIEVHGNLTAINSTITVYDTRYRYYIQVFSGAKLRISGSNISYVGLEEKGIRINRAEEVRIENSTFYNCSYALWVENSNNIVITGNNFKFCEGSAIYLYIVNNSEITGNRIQDSTSGIIGDNSHGNKIISNEFLRNHVDGINLGESCGNIIAYNNISGSYYSGIDLHDHSHNNLVYRNKILDNPDAHGISLHASKNNTIKENVISRSDYGLAVYHCDYTKIIKNNITNQEWYGVKIQDTSNTILWGNLINYTYGTESQGIDITNSHNITIVQNTISQNLGCGIRIQQSTGISLYVNNLINNSRQALDDGTYKYDDGFIGNYWSDYLGQDDDSNGVGDTSYKIDDDSIDNYPLMHKVTAPNIEKIDINPRKPAYNDTVKIVIKIVNSAETDKVVIRYHSGIAWKNASATYNQSNDSYEATIPAHPANTTIRFKVYAKTQGDIWNATLSYTYVVSDPYPPEIVEVKRIPEDPTELDSVKVLANISDPSGISQVILSYYNGQNWNNKTMVYNETSKYYEAEIPATPSGIEVKYKVYCSDIHGNWAESEMYTYIPTSVETRPKMPDITAITAATVAVAISALTILTIVKKRKLT